MQQNRQSGILLHPTSLPGPCGIGDIGPAAREFVDALVEMGQHVWQMLPLGPTGYGDSPYQSLSTFAGNPILISLDDLVADGLLDHRRLETLTAFGEGPIQYGQVIPARMAVLESVCRTFSRRASAELLEAFEGYCVAQQAWLDDYALFTAIKDSRDGRPWFRWPRALAQREPTALDEARHELAAVIRCVKIQQFLFERQWHALRVRCHRRRIHIVGDVPIFVAHDSADVWAHPALFTLNETGRLSVQSGVPPDYFSKTGQLWGNPLYRWDVHEETGYAWWIARMRRALELVDVVRIDHFRGFEAHWEVPGMARTAAGGHWVKGPGKEIFKALIADMGTLPVIAEDLGVITDEVEDLRDTFGFPGMRILQFAFGDDPKAADYRPDHLPTNCVVYTGTHDNDTTMGWFHSEAGKSDTRSVKSVREERKAILAFLKTDGSEIHWDLITVGLKSNAALCVVPMQDLLGLDSSARMNLPGTDRGNWQWRLRSGQLTPEIKQRMRALVESSQRL
ncbi:MAG: 4-alpha-glucanotransferase [Lentisphaerae bacterium]|nr:4-alpha-glucanotransferase [Lentisphaerota bacterium]